MGWTKLETVQEAYAELAMAGYVFDSTPEELQRAGRRLDLMMATWDGRGIQLGYSQSLSPSALDLNADTGLPLSAMETVVANLAIALAPGEGKALHSRTLQIAKDGLDTLLAAAALPRQQQLREGLPLGAGNKRRGTFVTTPDTSQLQVEEGDGGDLDFIT